MNISLVCACRAKFIFVDLLQRSHACQCLWNCYKTLTFCSLFERCGIPRACYAKPHPNFQKWSVTFSSLHFSLRHVLRANDVHSFDISTSKSAPSMRCFDILVSKRASRHNSLQFFIYHLARWLCARLFSELTFWPSRATKHWDFSTTFWRTLIFFSVFLFSSLLFSSLLFSSLLCSFLIFPTSTFPCVHVVYVVGSLASQLPRSWYIKIQKLWLHGSHDAQTTVSGFQNYASETTNSGFRN